MSKCSLLWFAVLFGITVPFLLWRLMRAEDGHGFMPISRDAAYILASAALQAFAFACFVFALIMLIA